MIWGIMMTIMTKMTLTMSQVDVQQVKKRIFEMVFDKSKNFSLIPLLNLYTTLRRIQSELGNTLDTYTHSTSRNSICNSFYENSPNINFVLKYQVHKLSLNQQYICFLGVGNQQS